MKNTTNDDLRTNEIERRADDVQTVLTGDDREAAVAAARDIVSPGMRKPASDDVETARIREARGEDHASSHDDEDAPLTDPENPTVRKAVDVADSSPL